MLCSLREAFRSRTVAFPRCPFFACSRSSVSFVMSGNHVASLFGVEPVDEVATVYGGVSWDGNEFGGVVRLDGLCDDTTIRELMRVGQGEDDSLFNNLLNGLFIEVGERRRFHVGGDREGVLDRAM